MTDSKKLSTNFFVVLGLFFFINPAVSALQNENFNQNLLLISIEGENWWQKKMGPLNRSLKNCDLGKGPGIVKGIAKIYPKFFADTNIFQDLESRIVHCMSKQQGFKKKYLMEDKSIKKIVIKILVWIHEESIDSNYDPLKLNSKEKKFLSVGEDIFNSNFLNPKPIFFNCLISNDTYKNSKLQNLNFNQQVRFFLSSYPRYDRRTQKVIFAKNIVQKCLYAQGVVNKSFHVYAVAPILFYLRVIAGLNNRQKKD